MRLAVCAILSLALLVDPSVATRGSPGDGCSTGAVGHTPRASRARIEGLAVEGEWDLFQKQQLHEHDTDIIERHSLGHQRSNVDSGIDDTFRWSRASPSLSLHLSPLHQPGDRLSAGLQSDNSNDDHSSLPVHRLKKTGTTIAGCCLSSGHVILAADTRATEGTMVADKTCLKLHPLARNSWCAGAGTSADLDQLTRHCLYQMALQRLVGTTVGNDDENEMTTRAVSPLEGDEEGLLVGSVPINAISSFLQESLMEGGGQVGANLILGGVWQGQAHLRALHPHGSMDVDLPFAALGSGGLAAMGVLERDYWPDMTLDEATELVKSAIVSGIQNDLGSGSQVDLCTISPDGSSTLRRAVVPPSNVPDRSDWATAKNRQSSEQDRNAKERVGVNGFGNTPYEVKSRRMFMKEDSDEILRWNKLLGVPQDRQR